MLVLLALLACSTTDESTTDTGASTACVLADSRSYDTAADPTLYETPDSVLGFSPADVETAMLGNYTGSFTTTASAVYAVDLVLGIDGLVHVQDFENCPSVWSTTLVLAMSTEQVDGGYLIDDLWSPALSLVSLDAGEFAGSKPVTEFDGTAADGISASLATVRGDKGAGFSWTGELAFDDDTHGTYSVAPTGR